MSSLQCVRAIAALLVVYFHAVLQIELFGVGAGGRSSLTETAFPLFGKCGVDVFFVLSGLLMWRSTARDRQSVGGFYAKRVLRIVPLYWTVTAVAVLVALTFPGLSKSTRIDPAHLVASLLFVPWPNPAMGGGADLMTPVVVPGWTLNFEIVFYLVFGLTLLAPRSWRFVANLGLFALVIVLVCLLRDRSPIIAFYDPALIAEFVVGVALGVALERKRLLPAAPAFVLLGLAIVALCRFDAVPPGTGRLIAATVPALAILYAVASLDLGGRWPALPLLARLGDASFSLYLTHVFVVAGLRSAFVRLHAPLDEPGPQGAYVVASLTLSCLVGLCVYRLVERPLGMALGGLVRRDPGVQSAAARKASASDGMALSAPSDDLSRSSSVSGF